jgi:NAD(P)-dependent dehydrogenase (short-subunit alcohol dehydrogenase family)
LNFRPAIITGAAGGIGRAIALRFSDFNCSQLVLVDLNEKELQATRHLVLGKSPQASVVVLAADLTTAGICDTIVNLAIQSFGRLDYLVNCAGIPGGFFSAADTPAGLFDKVQALNVRATWLLQQATIKQMMLQNPIDKGYGIFLLSSFSFKPQGC